MNQLIFFCLSTSINTSTNTNDVRRNCFILFCNFNSKPPKQFEPLLLTYATNSCNQAQQNAVLIYVAILIQLIISKKKVRFKLLNVIVL